MGNSKERIVDQNPNRMLLFTASSPVVPSYDVEVDAHLTSAPQAQATGRRPHQINAPETVLAGDSTGRWCSRGPGPSHLIAVVSLRAPSP